MAVRAVVDDSREFVTGELDQHLARRLSPGQPSRMHATKAARNAKTLALAYPVDTSKALFRLLLRYATTTQPVEVSFRELVHWLRVGERATHYIHPYPAKLLPQIAHFFLATEALVARGGKVLDPFGGSGTVALETVLSGRTPLYADTNPFARLVVAAKLTRASARRVASALEDVRLSFALSRTRTAPDVVNIDLWYDRVTKGHLARLRHAVSQHSDGEVGDLLEVSLSATARRVSRADPRLSVPVQRKDGFQPPAVWDTFEAQVNANIDRLRELRRLCSTIPRVVNAGPDARSLVLASDSVDLVLTSPPYAGAQKYIRASTLSLGWLGLAGTGQLKALENVTIGREHLPKSRVIEEMHCPIPAAAARLHEIRAKSAVRAAICGTYLTEMMAALDEMVRVLKPNGYMILVVGNNSVCGMPFLTSEYLHDYVSGIGMKTVARLVDEIKSRGLMTKRNRAASVISREWILVFQKPAA